MQKILTYLLLKFLICCRLKLQETIKLKLKNQKLNKKKEGEKRKMKKINDKQNIFGDNIAFIEQYDFSTANMSVENRILAITQVASICYQNPKALGSESLYNRLMAESIGLPSSSFEMCPILLTEEEVKQIQRQIQI